MSEMCAACFGTPTDLLAEFNEHQRDVFCVFSGVGVQRLRIDAEQVVQVVGQYRTQEGDVDQSATLRLQGI